MILPRRIWGGKERRCAGTQAGADLQDMGGALGLKSTETHRSIWRIPPLKAAGGRRCKRCGAGQGAGCPLVLEFNFTHCTLLAQSCTERSTLAPIQPRTKPCAYVFCWIRARRFCSTCRIEPREAQRGTLYHTAWRVAECQPKSQSCLAGQAVSGAPPELNGSSRGTSP